MSSKPQDIDFTKQTQTAVLGHIIVDSKIYDAAAVLGIESHFFNRDVNANRVFGIIDAFNKKHNRHPTEAELRASSVFTREEPKVAEAMTRTVDEALKLKDSIAFETVLDDLKRLKIFTLIAQGLNPGSDAQMAFSRGDVSAAIDAIDAVVMACRAVDGQGTSSTTKDSTTWGEIERQRRYDIEGKIVMTGIQFLDEVTDGIDPNDLVIVAAKTGVGKSQMLAEIARHTTKNKAGRPPFLLALEAYPGEMQRRLKWPMIVQAWRKNNPHAESLDWAKFGHGRYRKQLDSYEDAAQADFAAKYGTLQTLYRNSATFGIADMERAIVKGAQTTDLILLDHLHYVDTADPKSNEYQQQKKIVQKLREITLVQGKPIIAAAHLSKLEFGKFAPLLPPMEKVMGSSDITKIATMVIMMGGVNGIDPDNLPLAGLPIPADTVPTLMQLQKSRIVGNERTDFVAICFYDKAAGQYRQHYILGRLRSYGTKWEPVYEHELPKWAATAIKIRKPAAEPKQEPETTTKKEKDK